MEPPAGPTSELARFGEGRDCLYCRAPLDARFYFCASCATPYKDEHSVLTPVRPLRPTVGQLVKQRAPSVSVLWWTYFSVIVGLGSVLYVAAGQQSLGVHMVILDAALFVTTTFFTVYYWRSLVAQLKRFGFLHPAAWIGLGLLVPVLAIGHGYHELVRAMIGEEGFDFVDTLRDDGFNEAAIIFFMCIFPAVSEEIAFRGLLQHWLQLAIRPRRAILLAAALFSAMHLSLVSAPYLFLGGILLGWVKWKTGSLYPSMLIHFLHNLAVVKILGT